MFLAHLLRQAGIDAVVLERRDRAYIEDRVRAGLLEQITVELMTRLGLGARMAREGLVHGGVNLAHEGQMFRIDMAAATGSPGMMLYGQQEVMKDLFDGAEALGAGRGSASRRPPLAWRQEGAGRWRPCASCCCCL